MTFFKITLTFARYWNKKYWKNNVNMKYVCTLKTMIQGTIDLLNLDPEPARKAFEDPNFYHHANVYDLFLNYGLPETKIPRKFTFNTSGCDCINK